jgi:hypothetical protein
METPRSPSGKENRESISTSCSTKTSTKQVKDNATSNKELRRQNSKLCDQLGWLMVENQNLHSQINRNDAKVSTRFSNTNKLVERFITEQSISSKSIINLQKETQELEVWMDIEHAKFYQQTTKLYSHFCNQQVNLKAMDEKLKLLEWRFNCMLGMTSLAIGWKFWV